MVRAVQQISDDARNRLLLNAIIDYAIYMVDPQGHVLSWNSGAERFKGYDAPEILGEHISRFYTDEDRATELPQRALRIAETEGRFESEGWRVRKDGTRFWAHVVIDPIRSSSGDLVGFAKIIRDLTERRAAEETLRKSQEQFRILVQGVTDYAIYMLDPSGLVASWNAGARRIKGYEPAEIIGEHFSRFYSGEDQVSGLPRRALETAEREGRFEHEGWRVRKDESRFWASVIVDAIRDDAGQLIGFAKVTRDITEKREAERALELARARAEAASTAKTEFLASMSHEIRTPLNGIIGYTDLLLDHALKPEQRRLAERIQFSGSALLTVVNDILDFSRIEAGEIELHSQPFTLDALISNSASIVAELAERKGLALEVDLDPDLPKAVVGDEARLRQILLNLLNNAVKFTQEGHVRLHVKSENSSKKGKRICFSISDTGIGIPKDQHEHLFRRFHQVNQSSTRQSGGTGLGLPISMRLVQLMGGEIGVESQEGKGSIFWFAVPQRRATDKIIAEENAASEEQARQPGRILLVEDLEHNRDLARVILTKAGHEVDTAENGAEAVQAVQAKSYDLVLMDVQMPVMDGITATRKIRELEHPVSSVPIIAMTANVLPHQVREFGEAGMNDHVGKPFKRAELFKKVNIWLERGRLEGEPASAKQVGNPALEELQDVMGAEWVESGLRKLTQQIEETFGDPVTALEDPQELARRTHQLVAHAGLLGFEELSELCGRLEVACKIGAELSVPFATADAAAKQVHRHASDMLGRIGE